MKTFAVCCLILASGIHLAYSANFFEKTLQEGIEEYNRDQARLVELPPQNAIYDFIVVGGGSAGCVLASRLSEDPDTSVLLIEAGGDETIIHDMPIMATAVIETDSDWKQKTTPQKHACFGMEDKKCYLRGGKVLGGGSSVNFMYYTRGNKHDFDRLAERGNYGWSYNEVLPLFLRSEKANLKGLENSPYHNRSGDLSVEYVQFKTDMAEAFVDGAQQAGHPYVDYNGFSQLGVSFGQVTTQGGHRGSASKTFIKPVLNKRSNLKGITFARVLKVHIDPSTLSAYGVDFNYRDKVYTVKSRKEVILSAGNLNTPQLLMLSGIGPTENLQAIGIPQLMNLPVGKTLYDHVSHFGPCFTTNSTDSTLFGDSITQEDVDQYKAGSAATRISSSAGMEALAYIKTPNSRQPPGVPDIEIVIGALSLASDGGTSFKKSANFRDDIYEIGFKGLENVQHFTLISMLLYPKSKGTFVLRDQNPYTEAEIDPNYLSEEEDVETILAGIKEAIRITKTPAMQKLNATIWEKNIPGCENLTFGTDDYWRCSIRVLSFNIYHTLGTCQMGPDSDPNAVVTPQLKVRGIRRLRVADLSVMPLPIGAHTNAAALMIGEMAAELIRKEWQ